MSQQHVYVLIECYTRYYSEKEEKEIVGVYENKEDAQAYILSIKKKYKDVHYEIEDCIPFFCSSK